MKPEIIALTMHDFEEAHPIAHALARAYAINFWGGTWMELLAVRDEHETVLQQFGTIDAYGEVFPETRLLLSRIGMSADVPDWPVLLWELARRGDLHTVDGHAIVPYWTLEQAREELLRFVRPTYEGGYGGEILVLHSGNLIVGFTAYTSLHGQEGLDAADRRFPVTRLHMPIDNASATSFTIQQALKERYGNDKRFGIFLDHAISENVRGRGLGSRLFDQRIERLLDLKTDVFFGRTITTATAQYVGNYLRRGLTPFAADGTNDFSRHKHYFAALREELRPRKRS